MLFRSARCRYDGGLALALISIPAVLLFAAAPAKAAETALSTFEGGTDAGAPNASLIVDQQGALYGTTFVGGGSSNCSGGCGTVFKLTPPAAGQTRWTKSVLYSFQGGATDGAWPYQAGLVFDQQGALYGTTGAGGNETCPGGCGTVFKLTPPAAGQTQWTETVLYSFQGGMSDGEEPYAGLIFDRQGNLYGTTWGGGSSNCQDSNLCGTVFELTPPAAGQTQWTETVLYFFCAQSNCNDGTFPQAGLIFDQKGALYGTTSAGGSGNCYAIAPTGCGTVFKLTPPAVGQTQWTESVLYSFQGFPSDAGFPDAGLIFDQHGALYGTTNLGGSHCPRPGCGAVFKLTPPATGQTQWTETVLYDFCPEMNSQSICTAGAYPDGGLVFDQQGALYGTTSAGGSANCLDTATSIGCGTVFKLTPPAAGQTQWTETVLYNFQGGANDGASPWAGLIVGEQGALYSTTQNGGGSSNCNGGCGTVFRECSVEGGEVFGGKANLLCLRW